MLDIKQVEVFYPEFLRPYKRNLLREYLQYKILEIIYSSGAGLHLSFMGGTAAHILYGNTRFSEDLDFDNKGLTKTGFEELTYFIQKRLKLEGYAAAVKNTFKGAYSADIKIPGVLYDNKLSGHKDENLFVKLDAEPQSFKYADNKVILNRFDIFISVNAVPVDILLSQKLFAILKRKRPMGRDFYDAIYLFGRTRPNIRYLKLKLNARKPVELKARLVEKCKGLDFKQLSKDVEPFLFVPADSRKILLFPEYIERLEF